MGRITSSIRYKEYVQDYSRGLADVCALRPVTFKYKKQPECGIQVGFIAEELAALAWTS